MIDITVLPTSSVPAYKQIAESIVAGILSGRIPPGTALDEKQALHSLAWIREASLNENCVESLANHDADIAPHVIELSC